MTSPTQTPPIAPPPDPSTAAELLTQGETGSMDDRPGFARYTTYPGLFPWPEPTVGLVPSPTLDQLDAMLQAWGRARALEQVLTLPLRSAQWSLQPGRGDRGELDVIAELLTRPANAGGMSTPLDLVIGQMTAAVVQRKAFFEKVFDVVYVDDTPRVGYRKLAYRPARTCDILRDPKSLAFGGFRQRVPEVNDRGVTTGTAWVSIPAARSLVYVHGQHRRPLDGVSDLDVAYHLWDTARKVEFLWFSYLENQSFPRTHVTAPPFATSAAAQGNPTTPQDLANTVADARGGGVIGLPAGTNIGVLESDGAAQFQECLDWLGGQAAGSVLAGFIDLTSTGRAGKGSLALSQDQTDFFTNGRDGVLRELGSCLTNFAVADLVRWNFGPGAAVPTVEFSPTTDTDGTELVTLLQALAQTPAGATSTIPHEFVDELVLKSAAYLGLNTDTVRQALTTAPGPSVPLPGDAGVVATAVQRATQLVAAHRAATAAATPPTALP